MADKGRVVLRGHGPQAQDAVKTPSESIVDSANQSMVTTDARGRSIAFKKLSALERMRLFEIIGGANSENRMYLGHAALAACVTAIDGVEAGFPGTKLQLEHMIGRLDDDGLNAIAEAYSKQFGVKSGESGDPEKIKN